ncbi:MAG: 50S ribosomal protein L17 [Deltaproteobacteria bacterium]|nr:50S ribosomal protein L17 [Deltaproteobacteria bacterium]
MRHRRRTRRLGCKTAHRKAMLGNMVTSLLKHGRIVTTVPRAKEVRRVADKMVTLAKRSSLHARRQAFSVIRDRKVVTKLFDEWGQEFADRNGGYTRIVRIGPRRGDAAMMSIVELVTDSLEKPKSQRKPQKMASAESVIPQAVPPEPSVDKPESMKEEDGPAEETQISEEASVAEAGIEEEKSATGVDAAEEEASEDHEAVGNQTSEADVDSKEMGAKEEEKGVETGKT